MFTILKNAPKHYLYSNQDLRKLLVPLIFEQILAALMGIADTLMVSNVGAAALSGVSLVDTLNVLIIMVFSAMAAGGTIVCAQFLGRKDSVNAQEAAGQLILSCTVLAIIPAILCILFYNPILNLIYGDVAPDVMKAAQTYFLLSAISFPFIALQQAGASLFRAEGESKTPMLVSLGCNLLNIIGNALLIFGLGLGVFGAALATLFSRFVNAIVMMVLLRSEKRKLRIHQYTKLRPKWQTIKLILRIGIPTGFENGLFQFGKLLVARTVATLGTTAIAAQAITQTVEGIHAHPSSAISLGLTTVAGTCMGAGDLEQVKYYTKKMCWISELIMILTSIVFVFLLDPFANLANLDPASKDLYLNLMRILLIMKMLLWVLAFTLPNTMRASGDVAFCAISSAIIMWVFRVGLTTILCRYFSAGLYGIWFGWMVDWFVRDIVYVIRYRSGKWTKKKVLD